jgi:hypothetical protein
MLPPRRRRIRYFLRAIRALGVIDSDETDDRPCG